MNYKLFFLFITMLFSFSLDCEGKTPECDESNQGNRYVQVTGVGVRLRKGPGLNYEFLKNRKGQQVSPQRGAHLLVVGEEPEWWYVKYNNGYYYISKQFTRLVSGNNSNSGYNNSNNQKGQGVKIETKNVTYDEYFRPQVTLVIHNFEYKKLTNVLVQISYKRVGSDMFDTSSYRHFEENISVNLDSYYKTERTFTGQVSSDYNFAGAVLLRARFSDGTVLFR